MGNESRSSYAIPPTREAVQDALSSPKGKRPSLRPLLPLLFIIGIVGYWAGPALRGDKPDRTNPENAQPEEEGVWSAVHRFPLLVPLAPNAKGKSTDLETRMAFSFRAELSKQVVHKRLNAAKQAAVDAIELIDRRRFVTQQDEVRAELIDVLQRVLFPEDKGEVLELVWEESVNFRAH